MLKYTAYITEIYNPCFTRSRTDFTVGLLFIYIWMPYVSWNNYCSNYVFPPLKKKKKKSDSIGLLLPASTSDESSENTEVFFCCCSFSLLSGSVSYCLSDPFWSIYEPTVGIHSRHSWVTDPLFSSFSVVINVWSHKCVVSV